MSLKELLPGLLTIHLQPYTLLLSSTILGVTLVITWLFHRSRRDEANLPPGPPKLPIIGNLHQLGKNPHRSLTRLSRLYGPVIHLQLGRIPTVVVSSARTAGEVLKTHDLALASRPSLYAAKHLLYGCSDIAFAPYGGYWRQVRKICVQELLSPKRVKEFGGQREEEVRSLVRQIADSSNLGAVNLTKMIASFANTMISRSTLGRDFATGDHNFIKLLKESQVLLGGFNIGEFFPSLEWINTLTGTKRRLVNLSRRFDNFFDEIIEDHLEKRKNGGGKEVKDLVDVLLDLKMDGGLEIPLTLDNIKALILDMFAAGTDTTFATLDWAMTELIRNPEVMKKAQDEIRSIVGERRKVTEDDVHRTNYFKAVIKEIFRLHPAVPLLVPRESTQDINIDGYTIPSKTRVYVNVWAIGRVPETWERAEEFEPERFVGRDQLDFKGQDFELIPFGAGRRMCPGIAFAMANVELCLAQLLHSFDWELPEGAKREDMDLNEVFGITLMKASELMVVAKPRFV